MRQMGLFEMWKAKYFPSENECTTGGGKGTPTGPKALSIGNIGGHFLLGAAGLILATLVFLIEKFILSE